MTLILNYTQVLTLIIEHGYPYHLNNWNIDYTQSLTDSGELHYTFDATEEEITKILILL